MLGFILKINEVRISLNSKVYFERLVATYKAHLNILQKKRKRIKKQGWIFTDLSTLQNFGVY